MVGDLGSQVELAAAVSQGSRPVEISASLSSSTSSDTDHRLALHSQAANGGPRTTSNEVSTDSDMEQRTSESSQVSDELGELVLAGDGDLVVKDRFWTVFCKEVCSTCAPFFSFFNVRMESRARHL